MVGERQAEGKRERKEGAERVSQGQWRVTAVILCSSNNHQFDLYL